MNILMLSDVYFPRVNGVSTSIRTLAQVLAQQGHAVTLVVPDYSTATVGDDAHQDEGASGVAIETIRLPSRVIFFDPEDRLIRASALRRVLPELAARHWDVIHIHTPFRAHRLGVRLARLTGRPTVETYHTYFEEYVGHYLPWAPSSWLRWIARRASRLLCHGVDHLIVPSAQMVEVLDRYGITTPSTVIPTGIDLTEFTGGDGARFRAMHGIDTARPTLVTVSRLAVEKNIAFLLEVTRTLRSEFPDVLFLIAGEGPDAARLKQLVARMGLHDHVRFFGNLDRRTTLLDAYRAGDVFVFASPTETQGLVLTEAMALGVPIVSTAVMGTAAVLHGTRSAVVSDEDVATFAAHVADLLSSPEKRAALSAAGPADAAGWGALTMSEKVIALYTKLGSYEKLASTRLRAL
ncbi:MAG: glycosyltransferase [Lysobacter sp.]